jgi:hypothetical protein
MIGFIELTHFRNEETIYVRADHVVSVMGLPPRYPGVTDAPRQAMPARTVITLDVPGDTCEGMTRPANFTVLETPEAVMALIARAVRP